MPCWSSPGSARATTSTQLLRGFLRDRGYAAKGWGLGRNFGPRAGVERAMLDALDRLRDESGRTVSLVGWSLGGLYAQRSRGERPEAARSVITLAVRCILRTPSTGPRRAFRRPRSTAAATRSSLGDAAS
jgi:pimeloyl-ACP methyl ester carboxylesterase